MTTQITGSAHATRLHVRDAAGAPANADSTPVLSVLKPDGSALAPAPTVTTSGTGEYAAAFVGSLDGEWRYRWTYTLATQPGSTADTAVLFVPVSSAVGDLPAWAPTLEQVGARIPTRTRPIGGVTDTLLGTFDDTTYPTGQQVTLMIAQECAAAAACAGLPVVAEAHAIVNLLATLRVCYAVELAYPERDADVSVYDQFRQQAEALCKSAAMVNAAAGGGTTDPGAGDTDGPPIFPAWSFPDAPPYADSNLPTL